MATHSSVLAWRIPGIEEPGGLPSLGLHRVGHDWSDSSSSDNSNKTLCEVSLFLHSLKLQCPFSYMRPRPPFGLSITLLSVSSGIFLCLGSLAFITPSSFAVSSLLTNILSCETPIPYPPIYPSSHHPKATFPFFIPSHGQESAVYACPLHFLKALQSDFAPTFHWNCLRLQKPFQYQSQCMLLLLLLLLNRSSCIRLCATPQMEAHQAPPSLGFSRQEYWSGVPLPSPQCMLWGHYPTPFLCCLDSFCHTIMLKTLPSLGFWNIAFMYTPFSPLILSSNMVHCLSLISFCPENSSSLKISTNTLMQNYAAELYSWACPHLTSSSIFSKDLFSIKMSLEEKVEICCQTHKVEREYSGEAAVKWYSERRKGNVSTNWEDHHQFSHDAVCRELLGAGLGGENRGGQAVGRGQTKGRILYAMHIVSDFARVDGELLYLEQKSSMIGSEF